MDVQKFEELSAKVSAAKARKAKAEKARLDAENELINAREREREVYTEWASFVRDQAGFGEMNY